MRKILPAIGLTVSVSMLGLALALGSGVGEPTSGPVYHRESPLTPTTISSTAANKEDRPPWQASSSRLNSVRISGR